MEEVAAIAQAEHKRGDDEAAKRASYERQLEDQAIQLGEAELLREQLQQRLQV